METLFDITEEDILKVKETLFISESPLQLKVFPAKEKRKYIVLCIIIQEFNGSKEYSEQEINEILKSIYYDFATIRRYLIEYGFLDRSKDGRQYWVTDKRIQLNK